MVYIGIMEKKMESLLCRRALRGLFWPVGS